MPEQERAPHALDQSQPVTPAHAEERKERVLTRGEPSVVRSIAEAVVIKDDNLFFLSMPDGRVPLTGEHGFGLYFHDCRYLNGYEMRIANTRLNPLVSNAATGFAAVLQFTNPDIRMADGRLLRKEHIGVKWERTVDGQANALEDVVTFQNYGLEDVAFPIAVAFRAQFEPIFAVRGLLPEHPGRLHAPVWQDGVLTFTYEGADGLTRRLAIQFSPTPQIAGPTTAHFDLKLGPRETSQIRVSLFLSESPHGGTAATKELDRQNYAADQGSLQRSRDKWLGKATEIDSESLLLNATVQRSLRDLRALRSHIGHKVFFAAGIPWFATLFGRDSIITALQTLAFDPSIAEQTLRVLASFQGDSLDEWRDEQPGKIMHEYRVDELARIGEIPYNPPYYGTVDATPLFLILIGRHAAWTGDLSLFGELKSNVERAVEWMALYGDLNGDGYIDYQSTSRKGLINQGWKDSGDAIINADGSLAASPISLVEVQGYAYLAKLTLADLYERTGEAKRAGQLRREAADLRVRFNRDFWLEDKQFYALALQSQGRPCAVISSNPGHALWSGIADPEKAERTVERLLADDMFNGWGVRTLSTNERRYNPIGYHLGTVWPHDNAIIAAGCRRYGFDDAAHRIFVGIAEAAMRFPYYRLPELFAGFSRAEYHVPVHYPVACHPQAWAAGTIPYLIETMLGLTPEAFDGRLRIVRPQLPAFVDRLAIRRLRVGNAHVDLLFQRSTSGIAVDVVRIEGKLDIILEGEADTR